jgi:hypothetical protein
MEAITPSQGALVYNTDEACLFYYSQRWINLCEALGLSYTNESFVNRKQDTTIIITEFEDRINFEVGRIRGGDDENLEINYNNIIDFTITSADIQDNSITLRKLAPSSVDNPQLRDNAVQARNIDVSVAGDGLIQNAAGALLVDIDAIAGNGLIPNATTGRLDVDINNVAGDGNIFSTSLVVSGDPDALLGDVTLEIAAEAVGNEEVAGDAITSDKIANQGVTAEDIQDDAITAVKIGGDVAGIGLVQAGDGSLDVEVTELIGDGELSSPNGTLNLVGNTGNALFEDVALEVNFPNIISVDENNDLILGSDGAIYLNVGSAQTDETITNLIQNINTGVITYTNENGVPQSANISSNDPGNLLTTGSDGGSFIDQTAITSNETITTLDQDLTTGTITYTNENGIGQPANITSGDPGNLLITGSDGGSFIDQTAVTANETATSLEQNLTTGVITYANEEGNNQTASITSEDPGNLLITGSDGGSFIDQTAVTANETATSLEQNLTTGVITYANEEGNNQTASITSEDPGNLLISGSDGGSFIDQTAVTANETTTSLEQNLASGVITYTNEEGVEQPASITSGDPGNLLITGSDGGSFIDQSRVTANETVTTLTTTDSETFTYLSEDNTSISFVGTDDQTAGEVRFTPEGNTESNNVQLAIVELQNDIDVLGSNVTSNLSNSNLTQTINEDRFYTLSDQSLVFDGTGGNIGIGNFGASATLPSLPQDKLDVDGQIRGRNGFAANPGTVGNPSYGFYTNDDNNTGMYRVAENRIGFSTGGSDAVLINDNSNESLNNDTTLEIRGSFATAVIATSGDIELDDSHHTILFTANGNIVLPSASDFIGRVYVIKNPNSIVGSSNYIDEVGNNQSTIPTGSTIWLQSIGGEWHKIN